MLSGGEDAEISPGHHAWAWVGSGHSLVPARVLVCPAEGPRGLVGLGDGGKQGPGKGGLWIIGCSMKIKELCQRLLFLLASP